MLLLTSLSQSITEAISQPEERGMRKEDERKQRDKGREVSQRRRTDERRAEGRKHGGEEHKENVQDVRQERTMEGYER